FASLRYGDRGNDGSSNDPEVIASVGHNDRYDVPDLRMHITQRPCSKRDLVYGLRGAPLEANWFHGALDLVLAEDVYRDAPDLKRRAPSGAELRDVRVGLKDRDDFGGVFSIEIVADRSAPVPANEPGSFQQVPQASSESER